MRSIFQSVIINVITSSFLKTSGIKYLLFLGDLLTLKTIQCLLVSPQKISSSCRCLTAKCLTKFVNLHYFWVPTSGTWSNEFIRVCLFVCSFASHDLFWELERYLFLYSKSGVLKRSKLVEPDFVGKLVFFSIFG